MAPDAVAHEPTTKVPTPEALMPQAPVSSDLPVLQLALGPILAALGQLQTQDLKRVIQYLESILLQRQRSGDPSVSLQSSQPQRQFGSAQDLIRVHDDFDDPIF